MPLLLRRPTGTDQRRAGDGILHRHLSELGSPCAPVFPPNLSGATAIPGVIPFDGERSRDPPSRRDRNATIWIVRASPAARSHSPDPRAVSAGSHRRHCIGSAPLPREFSRAPLAATRASHRPRLSGRPPVRSGLRNGRRRKPYGELQETTLASSAARHFETRHVAGSTKAEDTRARNGRFGTITACPATSPTSR